MHRIVQGDKDFIQQRHNDIVGWIPDVRGENGKINPHLTRFVKANGKMVDVFHVKPVYYETRTGHWAPLSEITEHHGNRIITLNEHWRNAHPRYIDWLAGRQNLFGQELLLPTPLGDVVNKYQSIVRPTISLGLTTTTKYPDAHPESTTVDGFITSGYRATMALAHAVTSGDGAQPTSPYSNKEIFIRTLKNASGYYLARCFFLFDTSSIDSGDTISSATLSLYGTSFAYTNTTGTETFEIVATNPASNTDLVVTDFDNMSFTSFASTAISSMSQSAYNDFSLNASGIANVTKGGISKFGACGGNDLNITEISTNDHLMAIFEADNTDGGKDPKLVVEHAAAGGPTYNALAFCSF